MIGIVAIAFGVLFLIAILALTFLPWPLLPLRKEAESEEDIDWRNDLPDRWRLP